MVLTPFIVVFLLAVFAAASFFFALAETTLFTLGKWQVRQLAERHPRSGGALLQLLETPQDLLASIVLGNTFANAGLVALALLAAMRGDWSYGAGLTAAITLLVVLFGCEVAPKTLAVRIPEFCALRVALPMFLFVKVSRPLRVVAQRINGAILHAVIPKSIKPQAATDEDYQELLEVAYQQGALAASEKEIILQIIQLDQRTAKDVMKSRAQMACIPDDLSVEEMVQAARKYKHRRIPMYDETPDTIVGVLNTRTLLLDPQVDLADAIEFPSFVPESMNLLQLFKSLQRQQRGLAIVLDEYGSTAGVVTMEDILESMVGQIPGEDEGAGFVMEKLTEGRWRVNGTMRLEDFRREYPALGEIAEVDTMAGLLAMQLSVIPEQGESATFRGLRLTAQLVDERRVRELLVEVARRKGDA